MNMLRMQRALVSVSVRHARTLGKLATTSRPQTLKPTLLSATGFRPFSSTPEDNIEEMKNASDWDSYLESDTPIILQAGASWCGPCGMLKPMLAETSSEFGGKVKFVYMDIDSFPEIAEMLEIQLIPKTFMIYKGDLVDQFGGVPQNPEKIKEFFQRAQDLAEGKE